MRVDAGEAESGAYVDEDGRAYRAVGELGRGVLTMVAVAERASSVGIGVDERGAGRGASDGGTPRVTGERVAVKTVLPLWIGHPLAEERITREREISHAVHAESPHPCCARILAGGCQQLGGGRSRPFHVSPLLSGSTLGSKMSHGPASAVAMGVATGAAVGVAPRQALKWADDLLEALQRLHSVGWIHRDIKPHNVFVVEHEEARALLIDFGLAVRIGRRRTDGDEPFGTPAYVSPEVIAGAILDERSDLYSIGLLLFELLCGRRPFPGRDPIALLDAHLSEPPPLLRTVCPQLSSELESVIARTLQKSPGDRPASAADLSALLRSTPEGPKDRVK